MDSGGMTVKLQRTIEICCKTGKNRKSCSKTVDNCRNLLLAMKKQ